MMSINYENHPLIRRVAGGSVLAEEKTRDVDKGFQRSWRRDNVDYGSVSESGSVQAKFL